MSELKMKCVTFEAIGKGRFPIDMLRYDGCHPETSEDARKIEMTISPFSRGKGEVRIQLRMYTFLFPPRPEVERWNSFGWRVENVQEV